MKERASVLVVDDNSSLRDTFGMILKRKGFDVDTAPDGLSAVDKFREQPYDVVLMDMVMPRLDGVEALRQMRLINARTRVILMTAYSGEEQLRSARNGGAYSLLKKPIDITKLLKVITQATSIPSVLIVDDDGDFCYTLSRTFELHGYDAEWADSGWNAIEILKQKYCQIALVDLKMPVMDGVETYMRLREINSDLIGIMMTGYGDEMSERIEKAMSASAVTCLYKPFDPAQLMALVGELSATRGGNDEGQTKHTFSG
ncbi:MAG: response regulator [Dehalococcoidia bacterium]|nr:response regulator [Dehalococcoidia bacterium]